MIRILGTIFAGLLGLAFGSFLNVCLTRWPQGESIVHPRSHCRNCDHELAWWENIPLLSWLSLRGRCRKCRIWIGWRYPLVEFAVAGVWALQVWQSLRNLDGNSPAQYLNVFIDPYVVVCALGWAVFLWFLLALAVLDAKHLWLPDWLTLPGILVGFICAVLQARIDYGLTSWFGPPPTLAATLRSSALDRFIAILAAAALILVIRWLYQLIRHREGIGLGDAKLMALLAAWLGLPGALLSFGIGVVLGALVAVVLLFIPTAKSDSSKWSLRKLPLGTFLCIGGIISALWGQPIIAAYLHWAGF
jgi:leader peptidase (prepilin peptidase) / N-methyltransferase